MGFLVMVDPTADVSVVPEYNLHHQMKLLLLRTYFYDYQQKEGTVVHRQTLKLMMMITLFLQIEIVSLLEILWLHLMMMMCECYGGVATMKRIDPNKVFAVKSFLQVSLVEDGGDFVDDSLYPIPSSSLTFSS